MSTFGVQRCSLRFRTLVVRNCGCWHVRNLTRGRDFQAWISIVIKVIGAVKLARGRLRNALARLGFANAMVRR